MRKSKSVERLVVVLFIVLLICSSFPLVTWAKVNELEVIFINVTNDTCDQGDATLLNCNGKYVLIDGGKSGAYTDKLKKYLTQYCKKTNGKIVLEAIIASHNHSDHIGGLTKLLNDTNTFTVKRVIKSSFDPVTSFNTACNKANAVTTLKANSAKYSFTLNGTNITVYPPIADPTVANNRSMITTTKGTRKYLFTGDLYFSGIKAAKKQYPEVFNIKGGYDGCKFAHHGHRSGGNGDISPTVKEEVKWYKDNVNAGAYYLSASKRFVNKDVDIAKLKGNELSIRKNFDYIKANLAKQTIASYQGDMLVGANGDFRWYDYGNHM